MEKKIIISLFVIVVVILLAWFLRTGHNSSMKHLDTSRYFNDPVVAAFVNDIQEGNIEKVKEALSGGVDVNAQGLEGFRPIHFVFGAHETDILQLLLDKGADPNARLSNNNTPLHFAAGLSNPSFTEVLLAAKADPHAKGENDVTVIKNAVSSREPQNLRLLAKAGADLNAVWGGYTPLQLAITIFQWQMATTLLELGADPSLKDFFGETASDMLCESIKNLPATPENKAGIPALFNAFKERGVQVPCEGEAARFQ